MEVIKRLVLPTAPSTTTTTITDLIKEQQTLPEKLNISGIAQITAQCVIVCANLRNNCFTLQMSFQVIWFD